ncbi:hypothetical protein KI387_006165, partial [Taxus chinensis]
PLPQQISPAFACAVSQQESGYSQRAESSSILKKSGHLQPNCFFLGSSYHTFNKCSICTK